MQKKIAVCGLGWSGILLAHQLQNFCEVTVFEQRKHLDATCAWGTPTHKLKELCTEHNLLFRDYLLWQSKKLYINHFKHSITLNMNGLCTFNKYFFMRDLISQLNADNVTIKYSSTLKQEHYPNYDLIVDATGLRSVLGLKPTDNIYTCYQEEVHFNKLPYPDFYMQFTDNPSTKYLWLFPLGENKAYVGCGSLKGVDAKTQVKNFVCLHNGKTTKKYAKPLRVNSPEQSLPFITIKNGTPIVGVGNNVGAITSFGEGIDPSAYTTKALADSIKKGTLYLYEQQVLTQLKWLNNDYRFYEKLSQGKIVGAMLSVMRNNRFYRHRLQIPFAPAHRLKT